jgi:glucans biosynthesis protein C
MIEPEDIPAMPALESIVPDEHNRTRRHDVDWLRVGALGLLIIYHIVISFQPWAYAIFFIQNKEPLTGLWPLMTMINVWRIPILFLVSGMGVRFALERRDWKQLLRDRTLRILVPLLVGFFIICPISSSLVLGHYNLEPGYHPNMGHLWFLGNIFSYVLLLLPFLAFMKGGAVSWIRNLLSRVFRTPLGFALFALPLMAEAWIVNPDIYTMYATTGHGFWLGLLCFITGFTFVSAGAPFWRAAEKGRHLSLAIALGLFLARTWILRGAGEIKPLLGLETMSWMVAILGYASCHLNRPSRSLAYFSKAVYPVYILHSPVQFALSLLIIPLALSPWTKLALLLLGTSGACLVVYELCIRRVRLIRPLFGMVNRPAREAESRA